MDDNLTQMSLTMPTTVTTEPEVTPAVRRAADVLFAAEVAGLILDDVRAGLAAALTDEALTAVLHRHHMKGGAGNPTCVCSWEPDWTAGPWIPQFDAHLAAELRTAIVGSELMAGVYVPSESEVRSAYVAARCVEDADIPGQVAQFDAWLAQHDAEVAANTVLGVMHRLDTDEPRVGEQLVQFEDEWRREARGEADPGLLLILLGVAVAVLAGAGVLAAVAGLLSG